MNNERQKILEDYSKWTVLSALRQGPIGFRSKPVIFEMLEDIQFQAILDPKKGAIKADEFDKWHKTSIDRVRRKFPGLKDEYGWVAKLINVYLKTYVYIGGGGRENLVELIHPAVDGGLWKGIKEKYPERKDILSKTHCVDRINQITNRRIYNRIIEGFTIISTENECYLIEVEQYLII